jgi:hypothetical protein
MLGGQHFPEKRTRSHYTVREKRFKEGVAKCQGPDWPMIGALVRRRRHPDVSNNIRLERECVNHLVRG